MNLRVDWQIIFVKPRVVSILGQRHGLRHVEQDTIASVCVRWHVIWTEYLQSVGMRYEPLSQSSLPVLDLELNMVAGCPHLFGRAPIQLKALLSWLIL